MSSAALNEPFESIERQRAAATFGIWIFLASEILFFGGLFLSLTVYRTLHPDAVLMAAKETNIVYGSVNTALLLISSVTMVIAEKAADIGRRRLMFAMLAATAALGAAFLFVKGFEYAEDIRDHLVPGPHFKLPEAPAQLFFSFYWLITSVHALHLTVGIVAVLSIAWLVWREHLVVEKSAAMTVMALYWHLVDIIWIFAFPVLYLSGRSS
jgi:cytochrome c oxidase subunit III